jgi:hypothetical protein
VFFGLYQGLHGEVDYPFVGLRQHLQRVTLLWQIHSSERVVVLNDALCVMYQVEALDGVDIGAFLLDTR